MACGLRAYLDWKRGEMTREEYYTIVSEASSQIHALSAMKDKDIAAP